MWQEGSSGFGGNRAIDSFGVRQIIRTKWNTDDIWLRREFTMPERTPEIVELRVTIFGDALVFINGVLALRHSGGPGLDYEEMPISAEAWMAPRPGKNVLAVYCRQPGGREGARFIDVGMTAVKIQAGALAAQDAEGARFIDVGMTAVKIQAGALAAQVAARQYREKPVIRTEQKVESEVSLWFIRQMRAPGLKKADMLIPLGVAFRAPNREVSMSTSLLYHAFGIRGYQYTRTQYQGGRIIFTIHQGPESCCCSSCGSARVIRRGQVVRQFRSLPIGGRATFVVLPIPRVECQTCGTVRQVEVSFADPRRSYTSCFERYALELGRRMTIRDVAVHLGVGWDLIKDIQKRDLSRRFAKPKLKHLRHIAIDEIAIAKWHRYLTLVLDLETGAVVFVGDGKGAMGETVLEAVAA